MYYRSTVCSKSTCLHETIPQPSLKCHFGTPHVFLTNLFWETLRERASQRNLWMPGKRPSWWGRGEPVWGGGEEWRMPLPWLPGECCLPPAQGPAPPYLRDDINTAHHYITSQKVKIQSFTNRDVFLRPPKHSQTSQHFGDECCNWLYYVIYNIWEFRLDINMNTWATMMVHLWCMASSPGSRNTDLHW